MIYRCLLYTMFSATGRVMERSVRSHNGLVDRDFVRGATYDQDPTGRVVMSRFYNNGKPRSKIQRVRMEMPAAAAAAGPKAVYRKTPATDLFKRQQRGDNTSRRLLLHSRKQTKKNRK